MKRWIAVCLLFVLILSLAACSITEKIEYPVSYHYLRAPMANGEIHHGSEDSVIAPEIREGAPYQDNITLLLDLYLHGPLDKNFQTPFPVGTALRSLTVEGTHANVVLSRSFAKQSGIDLSLSCACLTLTVMDLTGAETVTISVQGEQLDGKDSITLDRSNLILTDTATPAAE